MGPRPYRRIWWRSQQSKPHSFPYLHVLTSNCGQVTLFGESAGAFSTATHLFNPAIEKLIAGVVRNFQG